jgi:hypothetical protein
VVVALKDPLTPTTRRELERTFGERLLLIGHGDQSLLVLLRPGETLQQVQARSTLIRYVDPEDVMGIAGEERNAALLIPAPRWTPKKPKIPAPREQK